MAAIVISRRKPASLKCWLSNGCLWVNHFMEKSVLKVMWTGNFRVPKWDGFPPWSVQDTAYEYKYVEKDVFLEWGSITP